MGLSGMIVREYNVNESGTKQILMLKIDNGFYVVMADRRNGQVFGVGPDRNWFAGFSPEGVKYVASRLSRSGATKRFRRTVEKIEA